MVIVPSSEETGMISWRAYKSELIAGVVTWKNCERFLTCGHHSVRSPKSRGGFEWVRTRFVEHHKPRAAVVTKNEPYPAKQ